METKNWMTDYTPVNVNLQHVANTFEEKRREQYFTSLLEAEFYKIKRLSHASFTYFIPESLVYVDTVSRTFVQRLIVSSIEIENQKKIYENDCCPLVYVMQNQSKFDCFITLFIIFFCKLRIPVIFLRKGSSS